MNSVTISYFKMKTKDILLTVNRKKCFPAYLKNLIEFLNEFHRSRKWKMILILDELRE